MALKTAQTVVMMAIYGLVMTTRLYMQNSLHLSDTPDPSSPLRGGSEVEENCRYLPYFIIWSAAQSELETKTTRIG
jgi:hypothetical protein